jgi:hypothetical protein
MSPIVLALVGLGAACAPAAPTPCSTNGVSAGGEDESALMTPGGDCIGCHSRGEGPRFEVAGTVMGASDDAIDCSGVAGVTVHLTGADGALVDLTTNEVGNFFRESGASPPLVTPFSVAVERAGKLRPMVRPQSTGNCMTCHTAHGAHGAPGRILAP